jgi:predicted CoA-binding protein
VPEKDWRDNLLTDEDGIAALAASARRVAVLGMRSKAVAHRAAHYVPAFLAGAGVEIVPVPVYEPDVEVMLGQPVYRRLADIPGEIDIVDVFRRSEDIPPHLPDLLAKMPKAVWFQSGIRNQEAAEELAKAGIKVVQDRCLMVEHRRARWMAERSSP